MKGMEWPNWNLNGTCYKPVITVYQKTPGSPGFVWCAGLNPAIGTNRAGALCPDHGVGLMLSHSARLRG